MNLNKKVLIVGGGFSGLSTALMLSEYRIPSIILERTSYLGGNHQKYQRPSPSINEMIDNVQSSSMIDVRLNRHLLRISGFRSEFSATSQNSLNDSSEILACTDIVFASGVGMSFPYDIPSNSSDRRFFDVFEFWPHLEQLVGAKNPERKQLLYILGYSNIPSSYAFEAALEQISELISLENIKVQIVTDSIRFHSLKAHDLYQRCLSGGVLFLQSESIPDVKAIETGIRFKVRDNPSCSAATDVWIEGQADVCVVESNYTGESIRSLFASTQYPLAEFPAYFESWNLHLGKTQTATPGIFTCGSMTGLKTEGECKEESRMIAESIFSDSGSVKSVKVDELKCAACLTCLRICPHHAISVTDKATIHSPACMACGLCIAECPALAISFDQSPSLQTASIVKHSIHVICCENSGFPALQNSFSKRYLEPLSLSYETIPCSGLIEIPHILNLFAQGVSGIFIAGCFEDNCKHVHGNRRAKQHVTRILGILETCGIPPHRLTFYPTAANCTERLVKRILEFKYLNSRT